MNLIVSVNKNNILPSFRLLQDIFFIDFWTQFMAVHDYICKHTGYLYNSL